MRTLGKRVTLKVPGFESLPLRFDFPLTALSAALCVYPYKSPILNKASINTYRHLSAQINHVSLGKKRDGNVMLKVV